MKQNLASSGEQVLFCVCAGRMHFLRTEDARLGDAYRKSHMGGLKH